MRLSKASLVPHIYWFPMIFIFLTCWFTLFSEMRAVCVSLGQKSHPRLDEKQCGCECPPAGTLPTTGMKRRGGGIKGDVALRVTCSTPLHLFSVKQGKLPHSLCRVEMHGTRVPGAVMRSSVAVSGDKLSRRPRCCLFYAQSCLISTTGNSLPTARQAKCHHLPS